jgi:DNA-binding response OmpR family regulator
MTNQAQKTILIVEDNDDMRSSLEDRIKEEEYTVSTAANAEEGLQILKDVSPDLIILDLLLPDKSGPEMLEAAKADSDINIEDTQVIILTSVGDSSGVSSVLERGMYDYFIKGETSLDEIAEHVNNKLA